ncbi:MAG: molybdenum cofactor guanylyltransferase [Acidimicrobiia bacterium]|nr:molybdenum cofactor guanylyltransferase [Acidimicrobiia bacterium]
MGETLVAVLAGGASRRMGVDKAFVDVAGRPMIEWVLEAAEAVTDDVVVVGRRGRVAGREAAMDLLEGRHGPAAGLATALARNGGPVVLLACDQPWVRVETLAHLVERFDDRPVVPVDDGWPQVTCAVYPSRLALPMTAAARRDDSIRTVLDTVDVDRVDDWASTGEDGRSWYSVDSPAALEAGLRRFGAPRGVSSSGLV